MGYGASVEKMRGLGFFSLVKWRLRALYFSSTFGMVSLNILPLKLGHYSLDGWTNRWAKHQLDDEAERAVVKGSYPTWRPLGHSGALTAQGTLLGPLQFNTCVHDPEEATLTTFVDGTKLGGPFLCLGIAFRRNLNRQKHCPVGTVMK
ncbi:LOW QUALITY PROTEIN: hypothetical protein QYF61_003971 [Mycteria americana]|uniref:Uncharacterized protein n=1 Tax=Mycteria americana TaxID=33587 RepID=A0AAN7RRB3_MYCAM|nr:LOW QUALITY PROTEIN: hypothetical protein QYF61_003971 [Mycteria americana]